MRIEIIRPDGDLKREVWTFNLIVGDSSCIYFDSYSFQTRATTRHRTWVSQTHWQRLDKRSNNIDDPPVSTEVETEMYTRYQEFIMTLPIVR